MREVKVKIRISDVSQTIRTLETQGCIFGETITQRDVVYIPNEVPTVPAPAGTNVLRIRYQDGKTLFTLKRSDEGNYLSKLEHELGIADGEEMGRVIKLLGYKVISDTTKARRKCRTGKYEICVDRVKEPGDFLEIEEITAEDPAQAQREMLNHLAKMGIDVSGRVDVGYDVLYVRSHDHTDAR